jgi:hypothetical protein
MPVRVEPKGPLSIYRFERPRPRITVELPAVQLPSKGDDPRPTPPMPDQSVVV